MPVRLLDPQRADDLRAQPLSYPRLDGPEGATAADYHHLAQTAVLSRRDLDGAARDLLGWRVHGRSGLDVQASDIPLRPGTVVQMRWRLLGRTVLAPCRVLEVVDEGQRRGFTYGTLPGHPEAGEERFLLEQADDGVIVFTITAYSRPASRLARASGPVGRVLQGAMTRRYLRAVDPA